MDKIKEVVDLILKSIDFERSESYVNNIYLRIQKDINYVKWLKYIKNTR